MDLGSSSTQIQTCGTILIQYFWANTWMFLRGQKWKRDTPGSNSAMLLTIEAASCQIPLIKMEGMKLSFNFI